MTGQDMLGHVRPY